MYYKFSVKDADEDLFLTNCKSIKELPSVSWDSVRRNYKDNFCLYPSCIKIPNSLNLYGDSNSKVVYVETDYQFKTSDSLCLYSMGSFID